MMAQKRSKLYRRLHELVVFGRTLPGVEISLRAVDDAYELSIWDGSEDLSATTMLVFELRKLNVTAQESKSYNRRSTWKFKRPLNETIQAMTDRTVRSAMRAFRPELPTLDRLTLEAALRRTILRYHRKALGVGRQNHAKVLNDEYCPVPSEECNVATETGEFQADRTE